MQMTKLLEAMFDAVEFRLAKRAFRLSVVRARRERRRVTQRRILTQTSGLNETMGR